MEKLNKAALTQQFPNYDKMKPMISSFSDRLASSINWMSGKLKIKENYAKTTL